MQLGVAQRHDGADHLLLFGFKNSLLAPLLHDQADLCGGELWGTRWVNAEWFRDDLGEEDEHGNQRADDLGKEGDRPRDGERDAVGIREGKPLRDQLAEHDGDHRDDEGDKEQGNRVRLVSDQCDPAQRLSDNGHDAYGGNGGGECPEEGDRNLDHRKEASWITHELLGTLGAAIARFCELIETRAANRDKGNFGTNEESVYEDEKQNDQDVSAEHRYASRMMRAGTPTAVQPSGMSASTTVPAPVLAPIPIPAGATISVPTPVKASAPISVLSFFTPL